MTDNLQGISSGSQPAVTLRTGSDLINDTQTMPPFRALDSLDGELATLDDWVSTFIGRLQPYSTNEPIAIEGVTGPTPDDPPRSPLERRIYQSASAVRQIRQALDAMNQNLAL